MAADSHRQWQHFTATDSSGVSQPTAELRLARAWALAQGNPAPFPSHDVMGNRVITLPKQWPLARPQLATREERLQRAELRLAFAWALQREQHANQLPVLPPCSWCGLPTGGWCDFCSNAICTDCEEIVAACRRCDMIMK